MRLQKVITSLILDLRNGTDKGSGTGTEIISRGNGRSESIFSFGTMKDEGDGDRESEVSKFLQAIVEGTFSKVSGRVIVIMNREVGWKKLYD